MATKYLSFDFAAILISAASYFVYHIISSNVNRQIIFNFQNYIYSSVQENKNINKINMSILSDVYSATNFNKNLLYKLCFLIKSIVLLFIIIKYNLFIALVVTAVSFVSFFLLKFTDKKIQKQNLLFSEYQNESLELFNSIQQGAEIEQNQNVSNKLKNKYFDCVEKSVKSTNKISLLYNINNNFITLILKTTIFALTFFLIKEIKTTALTLSLYLLLTPYLSSTAENLISFLDLFSEFGTVENALLNFDSLRHQTNDVETEPVEFENFNLYFHQASTSKLSTSPKITNLSLELKSKTIALFVGSPESGKSTLFNLLCRKENLSNGSIFIGNKNIENIPKNIYSKILSTTTKTPYFYNVSILENLYLVCQNKSKISKTIEQFGLKQEISSLKNKLDTVVNENLNPNLIFFLGILKCYLSGSKIICIYDFPDDLLKKDIEIFENILTLIKKDCLVIIFSNNKKLSHLSNQVFELENGKIIKNKNK